jgi:DNA repair exonuclease SbcCD ATPase subunit
MRHGEVDQDKISAAERTLKETEERLASLESNSFNTESIKNEINQIDQELTRIQSANMEVSRSKQENLAIRQQVEVKQRQIEHLKKGVCYTCNREWNQSQEIISKTSEDINQLIEVMKKNLTIIKNAEPMLDQDHVKTLTDRKNTLHYEISKRVLPLEDAKKARNLAEANLSNLISMQKSYKNLIDRLKTTKEELKTKQIEQHIKNHCFKLIGRHGFLGSIFDEVLLEIKTRANDLMLCMPNINTFSIDISSDSVTKSGKVNKKIKVSVYKDGVEKNIKVLSGGQLAAAELCVDLAVAETVRARSGSNLGWVALDEAMDGLDVETKMAALEIIKTKIDGLLVVVDHSTEIKEAFDSVIEVEYDGKKSYA